MSGMTGVVHYDLGSLRFAVKEVMLREVQGSSTHDAGPKFLRRDENDFGKGLVSSFPLSSSLIRASALLWQSSISLCSIVAHYGKYAGPQQRRCCANHTTVKIPCFACGESQRFCYIYRKWLFSGCCLAPRV